MAERRYVKPDKKFVEEVISRGGDSLKKCYQCSTCTVVCKLSPEESPFPRKEMAWAQWGLKDKLINDPDIWICQRCQDCSVHCPRDAKPAEVMAALREKVIAEYATPGIVAKAFSSARFLPLILIIPIFLVMGYLWAWGDLHYPNNFVALAEGEDLTADVAAGATVLHVEDVEPFAVGDEIVIKDGNNDESAVVAAVDHEAHTVTVEQGLANGYTADDEGQVGEDALILDDFIPDVHGDIGVGLMFIIVFSILGLGIRRFWKGLMSSSAGAARSGLSIFQSLRNAVVTIVKHDNFDECDASKTVSYAHRFIFFGCLALLVATGLTAMLHYADKIFDLSYSWESPWGILSPTKAFGIIGTVLVSAGVLMAIHRRVNDPNAGKSSYGDWLLLLMILITVVSGLATWLLRVAELETLTYWAYMIHIVSFFELFIFAPFSKGAHIFYRLTAMTWSNYTGRG